MIKALYLAIISLIVLSLLGVDKQVYAQSITPSNLAITAITWSPDGEHLALGYQSGRVEIWDAITQQITHTLNGHTEGVLSLAWKPDSSQLISGGFDGLAQVWDSPTGTLLVTLEGISSTAILGVAWSLDSTQIVTWGFDTSPNFYVWDATNYQIIYRDELNGDVYQIVWSPDQSKVALANIASQVIIADPRNFEGGIWLEKQSAGGYYSVAWSPDGRFVVGGNSEGFARVWELSTLQSTLTLQAAESQFNLLRIVIAVRYSADGKLIYSITEDGLLRTWDATDGTLLATRYIESPLYAAAWSPDGSKIAYGGDAGLLTIIPAPEFAISNTLMDKTHD